MKHDENLCAEIQSTLPLYVGGDLEAQALSEVRLHLGDCPPCAERALAARAARRELVAALRMESRPGPDLWAGVRAALREEGVLRTQAPAPRTLATPRIPLAWRRSLGYAAAAAAVMVAFWVGSRWNDAPAPSGRDGAPPVAFEPREVAPRGGETRSADPVFGEPRRSVTPVVLPGAAVDAGTDVAHAFDFPARESGGLRRLLPDERQLRDSAPEILADRAYLYGAPPRPGGAMQPVGLWRVGTNAPRW